MKSRFITIGTVVASIALSQALASAEDATKPGTSPLPSTTSGQQVSGLEGKIMPLYTYLSGSAGWGAANAGSAATSPSATTSPRDRTQSTDTSDRTRAERDRANVNPNDPAKRNPTDTTRTDTTKTETTRPDSTRTDASNPAWQGWAGTGASSFADQPMVFVAMRGAALAPSATSTSTERNPNSPVTTPPPASFATSTQGEAYVLLCNHNDPTSRSAFSKVQSFGPGAASSSSSDRVQVSGKDETDATRRSEDPARQPATDRSTSQDYKPYAPKYGQGVLEGKLIKVSGRILSRGGIQAIEVTSIDDTSPTSTSSPDATSIK